MRPCWIDETRSHWPVLLPCLRSFGPERAAAAQSPDDRRRELYSLLGDLPDRKRPIGGKKRSEEERDGYILETWDLDLNGIETVPAFLARPRTVTGRVPAVVFDHSHGGGYTIGKKEFIDGRSYLQPEPYAKTLTNLGYIGLAIDHWVFGERSHTTELDMFKGMLWKGQVLWGMMVYDSLRAMDWLVARPDVDRGPCWHARHVDGQHHGVVAGRARRTGEGHGRHLLPHRFQHSGRKEGTVGHGVYYYVPALLKHFTTSQINALIAPRAHLGLAGLQDKLTPVEGLDIIDRELTRVYTQMGHPERWKLLRYDVGHQETAAGRQEIIAFLKRFLSTKRWGQTGGSKPGSDRGVRPRRLKSGD